MTSTGSNIQANSVSTNGSTSVASAGTIANNSSGMSASGSNTLSNSVPNGNGNVSEKSLETNSISKTNLYIRGLTPNTTDKDLHSLCSP